MKLSYIWEIIFVLIGAIASAYAGFWLGNQPEQSSVIEYKTNTNNNLQQLMGNTDKIKITYGKDNLTALSNISFTIANTSKRNLDKIKIYIKTEDDKKLPIFNNINTPNNYPKEAITLISEKNGLYIFELEYLNRTDSIWDGIDFSFYFAGNEPPKMGITTGTKGISIQAYSIKTESGLEIFIQIIKETWLLFVAYICFVVLFIKYAKADKVVKENMFKTAITSRLKNINDASAEVLADDIITASKQSASLKDICSTMFRSKKGLTKN